MILSSAIDFALVSEGSSVRSAPLIRNPMISSLMSNRASPFSSFNWEIGSTPSTCPEISGGAGKIE